MPSNYCDARKCHHCRGSDGAPRQLSPDELRWLFGGECDAAMGLSSTHGAFERMVIMGPSSGGRTNGAELRMTDERLRAVARQRCYLARLAGVDGTHLAVLRAAYNQEDWTRTLDETHGRGPRQELWRFFSRELLQVAPLTSLAVRACHVESAAPISSEPVYSTGRNILGALCDVLSTDEENAAERAAPAMVALCRSRLGDLARWHKTSGARVKGKPFFTTAPLAVLNQLRILTGLTKVDHDATIAAARLALSAAANPEHHVSYVVKHEQRVKVKPPATPREYVVGLVRSGDVKKLKAVQDEARGMLLRACKEANIVEPQRHRQPRSDKGTRRAPPGVDHV